MSPDFDAIQKALKAGESPKKLAKRLSRPVYEVGPDGKKVLSGTYGVISAEMLERVRDAQGDDDDEGEGVEPQKPVEGP
jgi:hypothetical protein